MVSRFLRKAIAIFLFMLWTSSISGRAAAQRPDSGFFLTEAQLPNSQLLIRIDKVISVQRAVEKLLAIQGACWFNGGNNANVPRWAATIQLGSHPPLKPKDLLVVSANPNLSWRYELRHATQSEVQHYLNCTWPSDSWAGPSHLGPNQIFALTEESTKLETALNLMKVVSVDGIRHGAELVRVFSGACPKYGNIVPPALIVLSDHQAVKTGDLLVPSSNVSGYQLSEFLRPALRHATADEERRYASCSWPTAMTQP